MYLQFQQAQVNRNSTKAPAKVEPQAAPEQEATVVDTVESKRPPTLDSMPQEKYFKQATEVLKNPDSFAPESKSFLSRTFQAASKVTQDLMGHFLLGAIPEPVTPEEGKRIGKQDVQSLIDAYGKVDAPEKLARVKKAVDMAEAVLGKRPADAEIIILEDKEMGFSACVASNGSFCISEHHVDELNDEELLYIAGHEVGHHNNGDPRQGDAILAANNKAIEKSHGGEIPAQDPERELNRTEKAAARRMTNFRHEIERNADKAGMKVLKHYGIAPEHGLTSFLKELDLAEHRWIEESDTHPSHRERIWLMAKENQ